jgi:hypothetical protein
MDFDLYSTLGDNTTPTQAESLILIGLLVASPLIVIGVVSLVANLLMS